MNSQLNNSLTLVWSVRSPQVNPSGSLTHYSDDTVKTIKVIIDREFCLQSQELRRRKLFVLTTHYLNTHHRIILIISYLTLNDCCRVVMRVDTINLLKCLPLAKKLSYLLKCVTIHTMCVRKYSLSNTTEQKRI